MGQTHLSPALSHISHSTLCCLLALVHAPSESSAGGIVQVFLPAPSVLSQHALQIRQYRGKLGLGHEAAIMLE